MRHLREFYIDGFRVVQTSTQHPEQYDVYDRDQKIAYMRVRWGYYCVHLYTEDGKIGALAYGTAVDGFGSFDVVEREACLQKGIEHIKLKLAVLVTENENS